VQHLARSPEYPDPDPDPDDHTRGRDGACDGVEGELALRGSPRGEAAVALRSYGNGCIAVGIAGPVDRRAARRFGTLLRGLRPFSTRELLLTLVLLGPWDPRLARVIGQARVQHLIDGGRMDLRDAPSELVAASGAPASAPAADPVSGPAGGASVPRGPGALPRGVGAAAVSASPSASSGAPAADPRPIPAPPQTRADPGMDHDQAGPRGVAARPPTSLRYESSPAATPATRTGTRSTPCSTDPASRLAPGSTVSTRRVCSGSQSGRGATLIDELGLAATVTTPIATGV
jgi:hypothetical protein